jgi:hypothetical protein
VPAVYPEELMLTVPGIFRAGYSQRIGGKFLRMGSALSMVSASDEVIELWCGLLRCMSLFMARNGPPAMSAVWSLSGGERT